MPENFKEHIVHRMMEVTAAIEDAERGSEDSKRFAQTYSDLPASREVFNVHLKYMSARDALVDLFDALIDLYKFKPPEEEEET